MAHASALRFARPLSAILLATVSLALAGCGINTIPTYEQNAKAALRISDRGYVLAEGRNRISGRAADLLVDPAIGEAFLGGKRQAG